MFSDGSELATDRLYQDAFTKKKKLEEARIKASQHKPKLVLQSKETYVDNEERDALAPPRYLQLYESEKKKNVVEDNHKKTRVFTPARNEGCERLYALSTAKQMEGKQRREDIEKSKIPPPKPEFKSIPLSQATRMYERSMKHLITKEMKLIDAAHEREVNYESILIPESSGAATE